MTRADLVGIVREALRLAIGPDAPPPRRMTYLADVAVSAVEENGACLHTWAHPAQPFKRTGDPHGCTYRSGGDCASIGTRLHCKLEADHQPLGHDYKNINGAGCDIEGLCSHIAEPEEGRMCLQTREAHGTPHAMEVSGPYVLKVEGRA